MRSQFIFRRTLYERAVVVEIYERGLAPRANVDAVEGVRASGPLHKLRSCRRPGVIDVGELAISTAHDEVQVACERQKACGRS